MQIYIYEKYILNYSRSKNIVCAHTFVLTNLFILEMVSPFFLYFYYGFY